MAGSPASQYEGAFVNGGDGAVDKLAAIFDAQRPHLVLTYGADGGYGHPDHIRAHEITHAAAAKVAVPRIMHTVRLRAQTEALMPAEVPPGWRIAPDELDGADTVDATVELDDHAYSAKVAAMRAHATQLWIADGRTTDVNPHAALVSGEVVYYALSNLIVQPIQRVEHYQLAAGLPLTDDHGLLTGIPR